MQDGDWPGVKITGIRKNRRGAITPIYRRSGRNPRNFLRVGSRIAAPAANTITLEFASKGCGGFMPNELVQCLLDVYQQHICCGNGGDFKRGWLKIDVFTGIDLESNEYSDGTSYNREADNNELFLRHTGELRDAFTIYPLNVPEIGAAGAFDTGAGVLDVIYANLENCSGSGCGSQLGCADRWYAITNEGTLIYRKNANSSPTSVAVTSYVANTIAKIAILGSRLFVSYVSGGGTGGFFWSDLADDGDPGVWTQVAIGAFQPRGWLNASSTLLLYGYNAQNEPLIYEVDGSTGYTQIFGSGLDNSGILDMIECGSTRVGVGQEGAIWVSGCQGVWSLAPSSPTATNIVSIDAREGGEWWIGTSGGRVYYTTDAAQNWTEKTFPFSGTGAVYDIKWANPSVGYVLNNAGLYVSWDGGQSWETGTGDNDRVIVPPDGDTLSVIATPCCTNVTEQSNNFLIAGIAAAAGALWQGQIYSC